MDVGQYIRNKQKKQNGRQDGVGQNGGGQDGGGQDGRKINMSPEDAVKKYSAMSEEQLMQELFKVGSVSSGNVSASELDSFYDRVKGFITPEQAAKMKSLIMQLKMQ
jgi:hypothetical protein